jgi:hypothetical protein
MTLTTTTTPWFSVYSLGSDHKENTYWLSVVACLYSVCLVAPFPIGLYNFPIVVGTDRKENTVALLLPSLQALQFQYIILIPYIFGRLYYTCMSVVCLSNTKASTPV